MRYLSLKSETLAASDGTINILKCYKISENLCYATLTSFNSEHFFTIGVKLEYVLLRVAAKLVTCINMIGI